MASLNSQVSRPMQFLLAGVLLLAGVYYFALKAPAPSGGGGGPLPVAPAKPATGPKDARSAVPGGLGRAVDKANTASRQSDRANAAQQAASNRDGAGPATGATPAPAVPATPSAPAPKTPAPAQPAAPAAKAPNTTLPSTAPSVTTHAPALPARTPAVPATHAPAVPATHAPAVPATTPGRGAAHATLLAVDDWQSAFMTSIANFLGGRPSAAHTPTAHARPAHPGLGPHARVDRALAGGKVLVLLFWDPAGSDDREVHHQVGLVNSHGGRVAVVSASIKDVSSYRRVTQGVPILQSPTVVVVDRHAHATTLTGLTDHGVIDQGVANALAGPRG